MGKVETEKQKSKQTQYCSNCGNILLRQEKFCGICGTQVIKYENYLKLAKQSDKTDTATTETKANNTKKNNSINAVNSIKIDNSKNKHKKQEKTIVYMLMGALIVSVITLIASAVYINDISSKLNYKDTQIKGLNTTITNNQKRLSNLQKKYDNIQPKSEFMDNYIVIVPKNTNIYHKYDCKYLDVSSFYAFNIENARSQGYVACKHCIK